MLTTLDSYPQWHQAQQHPGHVTSATTPTFPHAGNSILAYHNEVQTIHPIQDSHSHHGLSGQTPPIEPPSRHFYSPTASSPAQFDPNPRPMKSPRHTEVSHNSLYQSFEAPYANGLASSSNSNRIYYPHAPAPPTWSSTEPDASSYATALHPPPQQLPHQTEHHQQQRSQDYSYASETYVDARDDTQNIGYAWSAAG
jgi:hypothetical protein